MCAHLTESVKSLMRRANTVLTIIPGGLSKILQPLDISVNRSFKAKLRKFWEEWMISGNHTFTKTGRQRRVEYVTIIEWILEAWNTIPTSTIINGFIKAGIINSSEVQGEVEENQVVNLDELTDINSECDEVMMNSQKTYKIIWRIYFLVLSMDLLPQNGAKVLTSSVLEVRLLRYSFFLEKKLGCGPYNLVRFIVR